MLPSPTHLLSGQPELCPLDSGTFHSRNSTTPELQHTNTHKTQHKDPVDLCSTCLQGFCNNKQDPSSWPHTPAAATASRQSHQPCMQQYRYCGPALPSSTASSTASCSPACNSQQWPPADAASHGCPGRVECPVSTQHAVHAVSCKCMECCCQHGWHMGAGDRITAAQDSGDVCGNGGTSTFGALYSGICRCAGKEV